MTGSSEFIICDVALESMTNVSMSWSKFDFFAINSSSYTMSSVTFLQIIFPYFTSCSNSVPCDCSCQNNCIYYCRIRSCCSLNFYSWFSSYSIPWHVRVCRSNNILYVCNLFMPAVFFLVLVYPAIHAGTLVLDFYIDGFFIFFWSSWSWLFVHLVKFHQNIVTNPLNSLRVIFII